ncbi:Regulator of Vps4 activity in the MVB pathway family protein [Brugia pahangi]
MSISWGTQYSKLKTNLRLAINRLKLLEKKKTEMALKSRTEIADFIANRKEDRARIRVEHIIREDFLVEAYELLEMYCDLILARFGLIQQIKHLDDGIAEAVINIIWAAPRVATDVSEFKVINDQLTMKYGKTFAEAARNNQLEFPAKVSPKLIAKLSVQAPPKLLVERYMIEIAKCAGIPFTPDPNIMREDEVAAAEQMLIDFKNHGGQGYGWMYPDDIVSNSKKPPSSPTNRGSGYYPGPPPPPAGFKDAFSEGGIPASAPVPLVNNYKACNYPCLNQVDDSSGNIKIKPNASPGLPSAPPTDAHPLPSKMNHNTTPEFPEPPNDLPGMLDSASFPSAKTSDEQQSGGDNDELDFDDLARRFDMLKKKNAK